LIPSFGRVVLKNTVQQDFVAFANRRNQMTGHTHPPSSGLLSTNEGAASVAGNENLTCYFVPGLPGANPTIFEFTATMPAL
jgi:hypothetical protein